MLLYLSERNKLHIICHRNSLWVCEPDNTWDKRSGAGVTSHGYSLVLKPLQRLILLTLQTSFHKYFTAAFCLDTLALDRVLSPSLSPSCQNLANSREPHTGEQAWEFTAMVETLWGCTWAQRCFELNVSMLICCAGIMFTIVTLV